VSLLFDAGLQDTERKVNALQSFLEDAEPFGPRSLSFPGLNMDDQQVLHRALMQGAGFAKWMTAPVMPSGIEDMANLDLSRPSFRKLPTIDFLAVEDVAYIACLQSLILEKDRARFFAYIRDRPLGLGLITAVSFHLVNLCFSLLTISKGAGFGKTELMAIMALIMQARLGRILCVTPANTAVDNFADRIHKKTVQVTKMRNESKCRGQVRRKLVVRAYKLSYEVEAFKSVMAKPEDEAAWTPRMRWDVVTKWQMPLSIVYWLLRILRWGQTTQPNEIDPEAIINIRDEVDARDDLRILRDLATRAPETRNMSEESRMDVVKGLDVNKIQVLMFKILDAADFLCITPALAQSEDYMHWRDELARGLAVDEGANMNRADIACTWGNTLLPCFIGGDPKQYYFPLAYELIAF
jgi:hypothetical protein